MSVDPLVVAALLGGGLIAGFINVVAGGGSLITMPLLIFLGVAPTSANGTIRIGILVQSIAATIRYQRAGAIAWKKIPMPMIAVWIGTAAGALTASNMADVDFKAMIGWVTLVAGGVVVIDLGKRLGHTPKPRSPVLLFVCMIGVGFYAGLVQAGVGYLFLAVLVLAGSFSLVDANIMKVVIVLGLTPLTIVIFAMNSKIHLSYALVLALGQAIGAYVGAGMTLKKGARLIRPVLATVVIGSAVALLVL